MNTVEHFVYRSACHSDPVLWLLGDKTFHSMLGEVYR